MSKKLHTQQHKMWRIGAHITESWEIFSLALVCRALTMDSLIPLSSLITFKKWKFRNFPSSWNTQNAMPKQAPAVPKLFVVSVCPVAKWKRPSTQIFQSDGQSFRRAIENVYKINPLDVQFFGHRFMLFWEKFGQNWTRFDVLPMEYAYKGGWKWKREKL